MGGICLGECIKIPQVFEQMKKILGSRATVIQGIDGVTCMAAVPQGIDLVSVVPSTRA